MDNNTEGQYNLPSFSDWWENNKEDYASFWKSRREEREDGRDAYNRLKSTYEPILKNLQDQYNELTPATTVNEYRPEIGYAIEATGKSGENVFSASTAKLFGTKAGKSMVQSSGVSQGLSSVYENFQGKMDQSIFSAYTGVAGKISTARGQQRNIESLMREQERNMI